MIGANMHRLMSILTCLVVFEFANASDKIDLSSAEQKYWSTKDDQFTVIQNRSYTKSERFYGQIDFGIPFNDPYSTGSIQSLQFGYYFSERLGIDLSLAKARYTDNEAVKQFIQRYGIYPDNNKHLGSEIVSLNYIPFYAKMSFLDRSIIYFDMGISLGIGINHYAIQKEEGSEEKQSLAQQISIHQQIFINEFCSFKLEVINRWSNQDKLKYKLNVTDRDQGHKNVNDTFILFGVTLWK